MGIGMNGSDGSRSPTLTSPRASPNSDSNTTNDTGVASIASNFTPATNGLGAGVSGTESAGGGGGDLLDLEDIFGGGSMPAAPGAGANSSLPTPGVADVGGIARAGAGGGGGGVDLLADIFAASPGLALGAGVAGGEAVVPGAVFGAGSLVGGGVSAGGGVKGDDEFGGFEVAPPKAETLVVRGYFRCFCFRCVL